MKVKTLFYCLIFFISYSVFSQISANRIDDFQDGSVQGWAVGALGTQPINIDDGGPSGSHDRYLQTFESIWLLRTRFCRRRGLATLQSPRSTSILKSRRAIGFNEGGHR